MSLTSRRLETVDGPDGRVNTADDNPETRLTVSLIVREVTMLLNIADRAASASSTSP